MQMAVFAAALANRGTVVRPSDDGKAAPAGRTKAARGIDAAVEGMKLCATAEGTCHAIAELPKPAAGKTGTARSLAGPQTHAWFIGFYPADNPEIAIAVFVPRGRGETDAAPAALKVFRAFDKNSSLK